MHVLADDAVSVCDEFELYHNFFSQSLRFAYRSVLCVLRTMLPSFFTGRSAGGEDRINVSNKYVIT